jgi:hypothetical protein
MLLMEVRYIQFYPHQSNFNRKPLAAPYKLSRHFVKALQAALLLSYACLPLIDNGYTCLKVLGEEKVEWRQHMIIIKRV